MCVGGWGGGCVCTRMHGILSLAFHFPSSPPEPQHRGRCQDSPDVNLLELEEGETSRALSLESFLLVLLGSCVQKEVGVCVFIPRHKQ